MENPPHSSDAPEILFHLRWVARIALWVGAVAAAGLAIMLYALTKPSGWNYSELIKSHSVIQHHLGPALLIGGFILIAFTAILTWLIALYSSFRIAGPLFRLSRNLEASISDAPGKPVPIRESDRLREEATLLEASISTVAAHYAALRDTVDEALAKIDAGETTPAERQAISAQLRERLERARF